MSTNQLLLNEKNSAYAKAVSENKKALDEYIKSLRNAYNETVKSAKEKTATDKSALTKKYAAAFDLNEIKELVERRKLEEKMANLGLSKSGLNESTNAALSVARMNSDNAAEFSKNADIRSLEQSLSEIINKAGLTLNEKSAEATKKMNDKNADTYKALSTAYTKALSEANKSSTKKSSNSSATNFINAYNQADKVLGRKRKLIYVNNLRRSGYITAADAETLIKLFNLEVNNNAYN